MLRKLRKLFFWLIGIITGLLITCVIVIWLLQDKIKEYAITYLNNHLKTELKVDQLDVTFLSTFPKVSLHFKNALILDPEGLQSYRDTLLSAKDLYLKFDFWDVIGGTYDAKQLDIYNAHLRAFVNEKGVENYDILKPSPEPQKEVEFRLALKNVRLFNTRLTYHNLSGNQHYKFRTKEMIFSGDFANTKFELSTIGDLYIQQIRKKNFVMLKNQHSQLDLLLQIDKVAKSIEFKKGDWQIEKMHLGLKGKIINVEEGTDCNVTLFGKNVSLVSVMQLLPEKVHNSMSRYKSFGNLDLEATIKGIAGKTKNPDVNAKFSIGNGILVEKEHDISLHNIDLKGKYTNKNKMGVDELAITAMHARFKDGKFDLSGKLTDFEKPHFVFAVKGNFGLTTLYEFINSGTVESMKGEVSLDGKVDFVLLRTDDLLLTNTLINEASGKINFKEATVVVNNENNPITDLNGQLNLKDNDALVDGLRGKIGKSDFSINGAIKNFTTYFLTGNQALSVVGAFNSEYCDINDLVGKNNLKKSNEEASSYAYAFPEKINFNFDLNVRQLIWQPFTATNIKGNFKLIDQQLTGTGINIEMAGGKCNGSFTVDGSGSGFLVKATTNIENVQLPLALAAFNNFGQELITPQNSKGILTTKITWLFPVKSDLKIESDKLMAQASVNIKKGELNNVNQLKQLAEFMRTDKKMRLFLADDADDFEARVKNLKFQDLNNELTVSNGILTIPKMEVNSSAMNLNFAGTHSFTNKIDYHFNFRFLELKKKDNMTEFGEIKDDGTGKRVYIHMSGDLDNPTYAWDKEERKADRQEKWQQEKETFKSLLKEEFGLFKKDTTVKVQETKQEDVKFIMEWDEADPKKTEEKKQSERDNQRLKKLKKKMGIDENPNKDVKFEIQEQE